MPIILTKKSDTASAVPLAADLTNAAGGAELAVNATDKRLFSKTSGGTVVELGTNPSTLVLPSGSANGVAYLNGSKVVTSGSALVYGGSNLILTSGGTWATDAGGIQLSMNGNDGYLTTYFDTHTVTIGAGVSAKNQIKVSGAGGANNINFKVNSSDAMTLTSTGLGIGTSSPTSKLTISGTAATGATTFLSTGTTTNYNVGQFTNTGGSFYFGLDNSAGTAFTGSSAYGGIVGTGNSTSLGLGTNSVVRATIDSSGNLGLGVTPSAWGTSGAVFKAIEYGRVGNAIAGISSGSSMDVMSNTYYNAGWKYANTGSTALRASLNGDTAGAFTWNIAPSGTAGNAITFTQAATLTAAGNFAVGDTASDFRLGSFVESGANQNMLIAAVKGVTNGFTVKWNHSTSTIRANIQNLPTSATGLASGDLYVLAGALMVA